MKNLSQPLNSKNNLKKIMPKDYSDLARKIGATDESGSRAEGVFCFTEGELGRFVTEIQKECIDEVQSLDIGDLAGALFWRDHIVERLKHHLGLTI